MGTNEVDWKAIMNECSKKRNIYFQYRVDIATGCDDNKMKEILDETTDDYKFISEIMNLNPPLPVLNKLSELDNDIQRCVNFCGNMLSINHFLK